jgi:hypothetical protein
MFDETTDAVRPALHLQTEIETPSQQRRSLTERLELVLLLLRTITT